MVKHTAFSFGDGCVYITSVLLMLMDKGKQNTKSSLTTPLTLFRQRTNL